MTLKKRLVKGGSINVKGRRKLVEKIKEEIVKLQSRVEKLNKSTKEYSSTMEKIESYKKLLKETQNKLNNSWVLVSRPTIKKKPSNIVNRLKRLGKTKYMRRLEYGPTLNSLPKKPTGSMLREAARAQRRFNRNEERASKKISQNQFSPNKIAKIQNNLTRRLKRLEQKRTAKRLDTLYHTSK